MARTHQGLSAGEKRIGDLLFAKALNGVITGFPGPSALLCKCLLVEHKGLRRGERERRALSSNKKKPSCQTMHL